MGDLPWTQMELYQQGWGQGQQRMAWMGARDGPLTTGTGRS